MSDVIARFDSWLAGSGPAALVLREHLTSVEGPDGVVFPATFAASEDRTFKGGYNIDTFPDGANICLVDSVGSQANRIEPMFASDEYAALVPQVVVTARDQRINLLSAGHRAGDAIVRCSALQQVLRDAFKAVLAGDAEPLAKVAPTSLVFGVWDSRDTQAKLPRLLTSTIRAFNVKELTRSAQFVPAVDFVELGLLEEPADKATRDSYAERGFVHVPASKSHGGVIARGGIRRDAALHLAALRTLSAAGNERTTPLRRYILGLALTAFTYSPAGYLRQGCNLVLDPDKPREFLEVYPDGRRTPATLTHDEALAFAQRAVSAFGKGEDRTVPFDSALAQIDVRGDKPEGQPARKKRSGKKAE